MFYMTRDIGENFLSNARHGHDKGAPAGARCASSHLSLVNLLIDDDTNIQQVSCEGDRSGLKLSCSGFTSCAITYRYGNLLRFVSYFDFTSCAITYRYGYLLRFV